MIQKVVRALIGLPLYMTLGIAVFYLISGDFVANVSKSNILTYVLCCLGALSIQLFINWVKDKFKESQ